MGSCRDSSILADSHLYHIQTVGGENMNVPKLLILIGVMVGMLFPIWGCLIIYIREKLYYRKHGHHSDGWYDGSPHG